MTDSGAIRRSRVASCIGEHVRSPNSLMEVAAAGDALPRLLSLPVSGTILHVKYEWDSDKAAVNLRKHGVDFVDAIAAFEDENRLEEVDARFVYDEERVQVIGMARDKVLFVVVTLPGEDTCRIISARKATRHEQDRYYAGHPEIR